MLRLRLFTCQANNLRHQRTCQLEKLEARRLLANTAPVLTRAIPDLSIEAGVPFQFDTRPNGAVILGFDVGGRDTRVTDNLFAGSVSFKESWEDVVFTGNTIVNEAPYRVASIDGSISTGAARDFHWDQNAYVTNSTRPFGFGGSVGNFDQWQRDTGFDADSLLVRDIVGTEVIVRPNFYRPGRGHLAVYNWQRLDEIQVDLSSILEPGQMFEVRSVLDLDGLPAASGRYDGSLITIPLRDTLAPIPIGHQPSAALQMTNEFAAFLVTSSTDRLPVSGRQWFVAADGTPLGDGSADQPWDIHSALSHPAAVQPGDTIWLRGGTYSGAFRSDLSGTASAPIQVRSYPGEAAVIDLFNGDPNDYPVVTIEGQYTHFEDIEIFSSSPTSRTTSQRGSWPDDIIRGNINIYGDHIKLINMEIHDLNKGLGFWERAEGGEVYGSLIYNNGWIGPDRRHGHAIYSQNEGAARRFSENITFNQFRNGIKIYGSSAASLDNHHLEGNISFNNGAAEGAGFSGSYQILIGGGRLVRDTTVHENYTYVSSHHFDDAEHNNGLAYSARQTNGQPLPEWLSFYGSEGFFVGTPADRDIGMIEIEVTATDRQGASVSDIFRLNVNARNRPPEVGQRIPDQTFGRGEPFAFDVSDSFTDPDSAAGLTFSIASGDGNRLPTWLAIEPDSGLIQGVSLEAGSYQLAVHAFDQHGESVAQEFTLTISPEVGDRPDPLLSAEGSGDWDVSLDAGGSIIELRRNGQLTAWQSLDQTDQIVVSGAVDSADSLTIDLGHGDPIPSSGLDWNGRDINGIDSLIIHDGDMDSIAIQLGRPGSGVVELQQTGRTSVVRFRESGAITGQVHSDQAIVELNDDGHLTTITTPQVGQVRLSGNRHYPVTLQQPRESLAVAGTGVSGTLVVQDRFELDGTDLSLDSDVVVVMGELETGGGDVVVHSAFFGAASGSTIESGGGNVELYSDWILLGGAISTVGGDFIASGAESMFCWPSAGSIATRGSTAGAVRIDMGRDVVLGAVSAGVDVNIRAGGQLVFRDEPVDGFFASLGSQR